jgi:hypothetical protein
LTSPVIRFDLNAAILEAPFFDDDGEIRGELTFRRARLNFGRFAVDRRRALLSFECLAKTVG